MARYVVLSFEDNDEADDFVKAVQSRGDYPGEAGCVASLHARSDRDDPEIYVSAELEGVFAKPTLFCEGNFSSGCGGTRGKFGRYWGISKKYGWRVCLTCAKPAKPIRGPENLMRNVITHAKNLLFTSPLAQTAGEPHVTDAGWGQYANDVSVRDNDRLTNLGWDPKAGNDKLVQYADDGTATEVHDDRYNR